MPNTILGFTQGPEIDLHRFRIKIGQLGEATTFHDSTNTTHRQFDVLGGIVGQTFLESI
ncbi:MAG TPA: hypothetical protein VMJ32_04170 [Pirellulales bacterium]|nr:hypothetical protein [Pirellulales bacterium]